MPCKNCAMRVAKGATYEALGPPPIDQAIDLLSVRRQRVQALMRLRAPPTMIVVFCIFGAQILFVLRFE